jgi:DNA-binding cell septation regulator SpoVG
LFADIVHPIDRDTREMLTERILEAYRAECQKMQRQQHVHRENAP